MSVLWGMSKSQPGPITQSRDNKKLTFGQHAWIIGACMKTYQHTNAQVGIPGKYTFQKGGIRYTDPSNPNALAALDVIRLASASPVLIVLM